MLMYVHCLIDMLPFGPPHAFLVEGSSTWFNVFSLICIFYTSMSDVLQPVAHLAIIHKESINFVDFCNFIWSSCGLSSGLGFDNYVFSRNRPPFPSSFAIEKAW